MFKAEFKRNQMNFYSVIIGTELLNGRRKDAHFEFLNSELNRRGWEHKASFVIKDEPKFIEDVFAFVKSDPKSVMFSFGGIGATPDDYTRVAAANVFRDGKMQYQSDAKSKIESMFGQEAYPHRIEMANLPIGAGLLENIVSGVPGFFVDERFFFVPGFPSMAKHMVLEALERFYPISSQKIRLTLVAETGENALIDTMKLMSDDVEMSSLPQIHGEIRRVVICVSGYDEISVQSNFKKFTDFLEQEKIQFKLGE